MPFLQHSAQCAGVFVFFLDGVNGQKWLDLLEHPVQEVVQV